MSNRTIFQFFHWYYSPEGNLWNHGRDEAGRLASLGVTDVWLPPAYKSAEGVDEPGYAVYDLYDLGEFDQKGTVRTRFGTKAEYLGCIAAFHEHHMNVLADIVLNHRMGGDEKEQVTVKNVNEENRTEMISDAHTIDAYTRFTFPGRKKKYSDFIWNWHCFTGTSENGSIAVILNEYGNGGWEDVLGKEFGNYDYLMGNDVEFRNPYVREELKRWGVWYVQTTGIDGFRLDAVKHINPGFFPEWLQYLKAHFQKDFFCIGEYWKSDVQMLLNYIDATGGMIRLFDVPLHFNFYDASTKGENYDLRTIFDNTLIKERPDLAISFVDNHDTQPLQSLQSTVDFWFKPLAYALILLREQGIPCVFYPAVYEARYAGPGGNEEAYIELNKVAALEKMMVVRKDLAYGMQRDFFDHPNTIGWTREGTDEKPGGGCAVLLSNGGEGSKNMLVGERHAGKTFVDCCGGRPEKITLNEKGEGTFFVNAGSAAVWVPG
ncbi:alpha-amylase [Agriterribacter sp.]|uniref:alpha-amylase n=1 Tax=Agriterribacter sp. TaxID=2821509 RepID=UPI002D03F442|nr:alpha-amylase [Agriterribacter sp.]HRP57035.1 alpha-amylase [Agriterribacter sp.]